MAFDYPLQLNMNNRDCLIVGAGKVAFRKARRLLAAGARVTMIAPELRERVPEEGALLFLERAFVPDDVRGRFLVFAATPDQSLNAEICALARAAGALANSATGTADSDFVLPAVVDRAPLHITISTDGASPAFAKMMRLYFEDFLDGSFSDALWVMIEVRKQVLALEGLSQPEREALLGQLSLEALLHDLQHMSKEDLLRKVTTCLLS